MTTGYVWNTVYGWADTGSGSLFPSDATTGLQPIGHHLAHPDTKRRFHELVAVSGVLDRLHSIRAVPATEADILRVHTPEHLARIRAESLQPKGGDAGDGCSPFGRGGYEIAALSAGGAIQLVTQVLAGTVDNGYALVNPPGHHATRATGMGFCLFNNVSVAAAYAKEVLGLERVAVVDWDVHHGNGTQDIWYDDPSVLTISLHQHLCFPPNSGFREERGSGDGHGYAINVPLPPGSGDAAYLHAMDRIVAPALRAFRPELVLVASGFDASILDPLARQMVTSGGFQQLTRRILDLAGEVCGGRIAFVQEGGYSPHYVPFCGLAVLRQLLGEPFAADPYTPIVSAQGGDVLLEHEAAAVAAAEPLLDVVTGAVAAAT
ncbi:acetoin utilization deacetylase AcuC-like enzyme [Nocardia transvalensis]|uniref:Acetoin utilization deacetylase AcuC-like enzyme n=1 Tax=Nocardia transvalensis TaxID=37333 RepID=A0A7W9UNC9_9NOCA|nr:class II histone deacetylase [Nocardia transvalensis]MBB5918705.1 acetoin utilization deacetylase AcuC-like enzyme [Nocardia transvalensis]